MKYGLMRKFLFFFLPAVIMAHMAQAGLIRDTELEDGFEAIIADMAADAGFADGIDIRIIVDPGYNAFVQGGTSVYLHSGLLLNARSPEEIMGVIAHEIGHLAAGHVPLRSETLKQAGVTQAITALASAAVALSGSADAALGIAIGGSDRTNRAYLQKSRTDESVADEWALRLLESQKITAAGLADVMRRMAAQSALPEARQSIYYLTHPGARERLATFSDHVTQTGDKDGLIKPEDRLMMARLITKLRAYVLTETRILNSPVDISWLTEDAPADMADYATAIAHYRRGDVASARALVTGLTERVPDAYWYHEFLGDIEMAAAQIRTAASHYRDALMLKPDAAQIKLSLARALIALNDPSLLAEAIPLLEQASEGEPKWAFIKRQLAIAYGRNAQLAEADLTLAEEALLLSDNRRAVTMARRALSHASAGPDIRTKAQDILFGLNASSGSE